jgi:hypothetical protein
MLRFNLEIWGAVKLLLLGIYVLGHYMSSKFHYVDNFYNSGYYPSSCLLFKAKHFGDCILVAPSEFNKKS